MDDNLFTNESEIQYPSINDSIDIRVLNNNTKLLSEQSIDLSEIDDIARESTNYAIESKIDTLTTKVGTLPTNTDINVINSSIVTALNSNILSNGTKIDTLTGDVSTVDEKIDTLTTKVGTLPTNTDINVINSSIVTALNSNILSNGTKLNTLIGADKWWNLSGLYTRKSILAPTSTSSYRSLTTILALSGSGKLIGCSSPCRVYLAPDTNVMLKWSITIDDILDFENIVWVENTSTSYEWFNVGFGIRNIQSGCPFNDYMSNNNMSNVLAKPDNLVSKTNPSGKDEDLSASNVAMNCFPDFTNATTNYVTSIGAKKTEYTIGTYTQKSSYGRDLANSFMYLYDDTYCLEYSKTLKVQFQTYFSDTTSSAIDKSSCSWSFTLAE